MIQHLQRILWQRKGRRDLQRIVEANRNSPTCKEYRAKREAAKKGLEARS